jgi:hypothetical protein
MYRKKKKNLRATSIIFKPKVHLNNFLVYFPYFEKKKLLCDNVGTSAVPPNVARQRRGRHIF